MECVKRLSHVASYTYFWIQHVWNCGMNLRLYRELKIPNRDCALLGIPRVLFFLETGSLYHLEEEWKCSQINRGLWNRGIIVKLWNLGGGNSPRIVGLLSHPPAGQTEAVNWIVLRWMECFYSDGILLFKNLLWSSEGWVLFSLSCSGSISTEFKIYVL